MTAQVLRFPKSRRPPLTKLWEPLWEDLCRASTDLPSEAQEEVIVELVEEIQALAERLHLSPISNPSGWLRGFILQANRGLWPPAHVQDYNRIIGMLKERKRQYQARQRRELSLVSRRQITAIWSLLARDPYRDQAWLYAYIAENYPQARREKNGRKQPSVSSLTNTEAGHIIEVLRNRAPARGRRRRKA